MQQPFHYTIKSKNYEEFKARVGAAEARGDKVMHIHAVDSAEPSSSTVKLIRRKNGTKVYENGVDNVSLHVAVMIKGGVS